jgi:hypothetical protein
VTDVWTDLEQSLLQILRLPHNAMALRGQGKTPEQAAAAKVAEVRSGLGGVARAQTFNGPHLFLRVVGPANRAYSGEWWFDASLLDTLEKVYSRIYFQSSDRKAVLRDMLRELLAVTTEWNAMTEVWALELPAGASLNAVVGKGAPQKLFGGLPLTERGNRMLVGQAEQVFAAVRNPLWVRKYANLR